MLISNIHDKYNTTFGLSKMSAVHKLLDETLESYYWMGFIAADGWLTSNQYKSSHDVLGVMLSIHDIEHLTKLANYIEVPVTTKSRTTNYKKDSKYCFIKVNCRKTVPELKRKFGIYNNKTKKPPNWERLVATDDRMMSMIIGYIDGDGSITKRKGSNRMHLSFQCAKEWGENLSFIREFLGRFFCTPVKSKVLYNKRGHATLSICRDSIIVQLKRFANEKQLPVLNRKWDSVSMDMLNSKNVMKSLLFTHASGEYERAISSRNFAKSRGLSYNSVWRLANGLIKEYKGWTVSI